MSPEDVRTRVAQIERMAMDDEAAHSAEDALHRDVLDAIANGAPDAEALAREALDTLSMSFARWCA